MSTLKRGFWLFGWYSIKIKTVKQQFQTIEFCFLWHNVKGAVLASCYQVWLDLNSNLLIGGLIVFENWIIFGWKMIIFVDYKSRIFALTEQNECNLPMYAKCTNVHFLQFLHCVSLCSAYCLVTEEGGGCG